MKLVNFSMEKNNFTGKKFSKILNKYYNLLGLQLEEVEKYLKEKNITYTVKSIQGKKDTDKLIIPKVIKISELDNGVELLTTKFSDSLK